MVAVTLGDTIVLRDGSHVSGEVKMCDDEQCAIGSKHFPLGQIAAILLGQTTLPATAAAGSIVLTDGSVRRGHFDFLNLGSVTVDGNDVDRGEIAAIILADIEQPKRDVLVTRDGQSRVGTLTLCNAASCTLDSDVVPRDATRWIGLAQSGSTPPQPPPTEDTVLLAGKSPVTARVTHIDASTVRTTHGDFARKDVTWIFVADAQTAAPSPPAQPAVENKNPPPQVPQPPHPPVQPPAKTPPAPVPQPAPTARPNCKPGALWTGKITAHAWGNVDQTRSDLFIDAQVRLQETICGSFGLDGKRIGSVSIFDPSGSFIKNRMTQVNPYFSCKGEGSGPAASTGRGHAIYRNDRDATNRGFGFEVPRGKALYFVILGAAHDAKQVTVCNTPQGTSTRSDDLFGTPEAGRNPVLHSQWWEDPDLRFLDDGKMIGSATAPAPGAFEHVAFSWAICPEHVQCSAPPPIPDGSGPKTGPPANKNPCDELQSLIKAMKELAGTYKQFEHDFKDASHKRDVVRDEVWGFDGALRTYFTSLAALAAQGASAGVQKLVGLAKTLMGMSGTGNTTDVVEAAKALGYGPSDLLNNAAAAAAVKAATNQADAYLAQTGDDAGALRLYAAATGRSDALAAAGKAVTKGISIGTGIADYAEKTSSLADLIQEWLDHDEQATRAQNEMDDVQKRMDDLQKQIDDARSRLTEPCGSATLERRPVIQFATLRDAPLLYPLVQQSPPGSGAGAKLAAIRLQLDAATNHLVAAGSWIDPFLFQVPMSPRLRSALLGQAVPDLQAAKQALDSAAQQGQNIEDDVSHTVPKNNSNAPPKTTTEALHRTIKGKAKT